MKQTIWLALAVILLACPTADAQKTKLERKTVQYKQGDAQLEGYLVWDANRTGKRPGVLVVHEWWGLDDHARKRADMLAELGYVAFALDMYGKGKLTEHPKQAKAWSSQIRGNVDQWVKRANAGLAELLKHSAVDKSRLAAIGYCFGGSTVLQMAYNGAPLKAVVTFHGGLVVPDEKQAKKLRSSILVCHGANDAFIPEKTIAAFRNALTEAKADWQMVYYANAVHSFTVPGAGKKNIPGIAYNRLADLRSWRNMRGFFDLLFDEKK